MSFDLRPYLDREEDQHFERKSLLAGRPGQKHSREHWRVRDQVARYVAAFANTEGGVLILGIEDDGVLTGHRFSARALYRLLAAPRTRLIPPQAEGEVVTYQGQEFLVYVVSVAPAPVRVKGGGFPVRVGDQTLRRSRAQVEDILEAGDA